VLIYCLENCNTEIQFYFIVYRVNWLRAKARYDRWSEELKLVREEMRWTKRCFAYHSREWARRAEAYKENGDKRGHYSYALSQVHMWNSWEERAHGRFIEVLGENGI
jgi:hypothetical protein